MNKNTLLIIVLAIIVCIIGTIIINKKINNSEHAIQQLKNKNEVLLKEYDSVNFLLQKEVAFRIKKDNEIDSLNKRIIKNENDEIALQKELKNIKGKYKNYSNDSLYKETLIAFKKDTTKRDSTVITNIPIPRPVLEWCLECDNTVTILYKRIDKKDSVINDLKVVVTKQEEKISSYQRDSVSKEVQINGLFKVIDNDNQIITIQDTTIKKERRKFWVVLGGVIITFITLEIITNE